MTRSGTPRDLRERMERVAFKPGRPVESVSRRRAARAGATEPTDVNLQLVADAKHASVATARAIRAPRRSARTASQSATTGAQPNAQRPTERSVPAPHSRLEALFAWGMWELTVVPARRWQYLTTLIGAGATSARNSKRGS